MEANYFSSYFSSNSKFRQQMFITKISAEIMLQSLLRLKTKVTEIETYTFSKTEIFFQPRDEISYSYFIIIWRNIKQENNLMFDSQLYHEYTWTKPSGRNPRS